MTKLAEFLRAQKQIQTLPDSSKLLDAQYVRALMQAKQATKMQ
jgi:hypothetical protein